MLELWEMLRKRAVPGAFLKRAGTALRSPMNVAVAIRRKVGIRNRVARRWRMRALFECLPHPDNRVCLSDERDALGRRQVRVKWQLGEQDLQSVIRAHQLLDRALQRSDLGSLELRFPDESSWKAAVEGGKHHMGTTRMNASPAHGVVDADCKVHGTANLFVAGSSVFPTGGFANPTLTIVALAVRLAAHLKSRIA
jgi:choline dehydrogenase-like flavoprotein